MSTPRYAMQDTRKPDGFYIHLVREILPDDCQDTPDERDEGFWPSRDEKAAGYVLPENYESERAKAYERMEAWRRGDWGYVGVRAKALCLIVRNGTGVHMTLESPGVWGIESDAGDYLNEVYQEEIEALKSLIAAMQSPVYE